MRWSPALSIDDSQIDFQHHQLLDTMDELEAALATSDPAPVRATAAFLRQYAQVHFADEERVCALAGWSGLAEHRTLHAIFRSRLAGLEAALERGDLAAGRAALDFLSSWLIEHIRGADREFAEAVRAVRPLRSTEA